jgi:hypothetical protein
VINPSGTPIAIAKANDGDGNLECAASAEDYAGEQIAPEIVGPEGEGGARRLQALQQVRGDDV